jgi:hypothetical protein
MVNIGKTGFNMNLGKMNGIDSTVGGFSSPVGGSESGSRSWDNHEFDAPVDSLCAWGGFPIRPGHRSQLMREKGKNGVVQLNHDSSHIPEEPCYRDVTGANLPNVLANLEL